MMTPAVKKIFGFVLPYWLTWIPGMLVFTSQIFVFGLINAYFLRMMTSAIMTALGTQDTAAAFSEVWRAVIIFTAITAGVLLVLAFGVYVYFMSAMRATRDLQKAVFRSFVTDSIENATASHSGEGIAAINTDSNTATNLFSDALATFMFAFTGIAGSVVTVFLIDWRLGAMVVGMGVFFLVVQALFAKPLGRIGKRRLEVNAASVAATSNIFAGGMAIRAFGIQDRALVTFNAENNKLLRLNFKEAFIGMWQDLFTTLQGWVTIIIVMAFGGWLVATGDESLTLPAIVMALPMCMSLNTSIGMIGVAIAGFQAPKEAAERVAKVLASAEGHQWSKNKNVAFLDNLKNAEHSTLTLEDFSFQYKDAPAPILKNISLTVNPRETVAFVGASGSGKSTLLRAIIGLYERDGLNMRYGDVEFSPQSAEAWRQNFAYVDQSCKLFDMTVAENIALGNLAGISGTPEEEIKEAAQRAAALDFIEALPEGFASGCGEKGASLSGGQKQRIAIARALCRRAPILVFDEATSALDADSERSIMQTIEDLRKDHTVLIVTHNLQNTVTADKIVVLSGGEIAKVGTHEELLARGGVYSGLYTRDV